MSIKQCRFLPLYGHISLVELTALYTMAEKKNAAFHNRKLCGNVWTPFSHLHLQRSPDLQVVDVGFHCRLCMQPAYYYTWVRKYRKSRHLCLYSLFLHTKTVVWIYSTFDLAVRAIIVPNLLKCPTRHDIFVTTRSHRVPHITLWLEYMYTNILY